MYAIEHTKTNSTQLMKEEEEEVLECYRLLLFGKGKQITIKR